MGNWIADFKAFALRGNVVDMAVGIVIGAAFGKIVSTFVSSIISPLMSLITGGLDFKGLSYMLEPAVMEGEKVVRPAVVLTYGEFIQVVIDFIIIAFAIFWVIRMMNKVVKQKPKDPPPTPEDTLLLREIRDSLKKDNEAV